MDVMERRRALLVMPHGLDTSPIIEEWYKKLPSGNGAYIDDQESAVTIAYEYPPSNQEQTLTAFGTLSIIRIYQNGTYLDYWGFNSRNNELTRNVINANSNAIQFDIYIPEIDYCYAYIVETGQIFFAGKNTPYYGHRNISELN